MRGDLDRELNLIEQRLGFYLGRLVLCPLVPPDHVYFSLTNRCNLRCRMCDISRNPTTAQEELSTAKIKEIIRQIKELGVRHLIFSGGDPFLRNDIMEIIEFASSLNFEMVDIITNGMFLTPETIERLIRAKLNHVTISLDGLGETNDKIRGEGVFNKAQENIGLLNRVKSSHGLLLPTVGINFTIMEDNIDDILPMIEFARQNQCNAIFFQPVLFDNTRMYRKKENDLWPSEKSIVRLKAILEQVIRLKNEIKDFVICSEDELLRALPDYFRGKRTRPSFKCYEGIKRIVITYSGNLWSCSGVYGDLRVKTLPEIWFSEEAVEVRNKAGRCRKHCLQDCVYLPSNIFHQFENFLEKLSVKEQKEKDEIKKRLSVRLEGYIRQLQKTIGEQKGAFRLFRRRYLKGELKNLGRIKNDISSC
jgi:MoaA/NifB/PqqE/SkfB family radical SAM enzyme